jgi:hypothetical protein
MLSRALALLTAVLVALLAGGMVLIRVVLVPFWRGASPADFRDWFAAHSGRIRSLMVPLGVGAAVAGTASAIAQVAEGARVPQRPLRRQEPRRASSPSPSP